MATSSSSATSLDLALGVISAPPFRARRDAIRTTWLRNVPPQVFVRFVVRAGDCNMTSGRRLRGHASPHAVPTTSASPPENEDDVLRIRSVCASEDRRRGAVLTIFAWLQHAVRSFPNATFIAKADDDIWLDIPALRIYLNAVREGAEQRGAPHVFMGNLLYSSYVTNGTREYDTGFGYDCGQARGSFRNLVKWSPSMSSTSLGPFTFAPGFLNVLSQALAAKLVDSQGLQENVKYIQDQKGVFGLEDKWLGSAIQRHANLNSSGMLLVHMGKILFDAPGMHILSTAILWHNGRKDLARMPIVDTFARQHGCFSPSNNESSITPSLHCSSEPAPCAPPNSFRCTLKTACEPRHYMHDYARTDSWRLCQNLSLFTKCVAAPVAGTL